MANTYTKLYVHFIWSTKNREPLIAQDIEERVWAYIAGIARENGMPPVAIGGIEDHVHALVVLPKTRTMAEAVKQMKGGSSSWINGEKLVKTRFAWQDGYGGFSVSPSKVDEVARYIRNQREHHKTMTFQEEYIGLIERHGIEYDEKYLWG